MVSSVFLYLLMLYLNFIFSALLINRIWPSLLWMGCFKESLLCVQKNKVKIRMLGKLDIKKCSIYRHLMNSKMVLAEATLWFYHTIAILMNWCQNYTFMLSFPRYFVTIYFRLWNLINCFCYLYLNAVKNFFNRTSYDFLCGLSYNI